MGLFIKKPFAALQAEAYESGNKTLKRVLGPWSLIALGVGVIIGADYFPSREQWPQDTQVLPLLYLLP